MGRTKQRINRSNVTEFCFFVFFFLNNHHLSETKFKAFSLQNITTTQQVKEKKKAKSSNSLLFKKVLLNSGTPSVSIIHSSYIQLYI